MIKYKYIPMNYSDAIARAKYFLPPFPDILTVEKLTKTIQLIDTLRHYLILYNIPSNHNSNLRKLIIQTIFQILENTDLIYSYILENNNRKVNKFKQNLLKIYDLLEKSISNPEQNISQDLSNLIKYFQKLIFLRI